MPGSTINSLTDFIREIGPNKARYSEVRCFRGHSGVGLPLTPSIFRSKEYAANEYLILRDLLASHPGDFENDRTTLEQLVRVQHYSLPTRLLDVTWNPLVSLYFACQVKVDHGSPVDGEVFVLRVKREDVNFYDSDKVSCLSNLAYLRKDLRDKIDISKTVKRFNEDLPIKRLLHFIKFEKPQFLSEIVPADLDRILCVKPKQSNRRILAQAGAFLIFGLREEMPWNGSDGIEVRRIQIPHGRKKTILRELDDISINQSTMFPEIERTAAYIRDGLPRRPTIRLRTRAPVA